MREKVGKYIAFSFKTLETGFKLWIVLLGISMALFVGNIATFPPFSTVGSFNGEPLQGKLRSERQGAVEIRFTSVSFRSPTLVFATLGVFNPIIQMGAVLVACITWVLIWRGFLIPLRAKTNTGYKMLWGILHILATALFLFLSIVLLDMLLEALKPVTYGEQRKALFAWFMPSVLLFCGMQSLFKVPKFYAICGFLVMQFLLMGMIVKNHNTYCFQREFERPLLSQMTKYCRK